MTTSNELPSFLRPRLLGAVMLGVCLAALAFAQDDDASAGGLEQAPTPTKFRVGEKLSYNFSFGRFLNAGHAEIAVQSRGKLRGIDVVELRSRVKTFEVVSAAFLMIDETRTAYVQPGTGIPVYITKVTNTGILPKETIVDYLKVPTNSLDLLTLFYRLREAGGVGSFTVTENEQLHTVTLTPSGVERLRTDLGDLDTSVSAVQSDLFAGLGIKEMQVGFMTDEHRIPAFLRFKTPKGNFRAVLSAITLPEPVTVKSTPTPTPAPTPATKPSPTPEVYVDNQPLLPELGFQLGEVLEYRATLNGRNAGRVSLNARERKRIDKVDTLFLRASVIAAEPGFDALRAGDHTEARVDPETLAPRYAESRFASPFLSLNQTLTFDQETGAISMGGKSAVDAPVGTHTVLSMLYAMRSFNLKPSKEPSNPVNDTRVAIFWGERPVVWTLRPSYPGELLIDGQKYAAQLISITTGDPALDALSLKVWLGAEDRVPLRLIAGSYILDLVSRGSNLPQ